MMRLDPECWRALSPRMRVVVWLVSLCGLTGLCGGGFLLTPYQARTAGEEQLRQQQAALGAQRQKTGVLQGELTRESRAPLQVVVPFSPLDTPSVGAQLVSWQPNQKGGELVLEGRWLPLAATFIRLSEQGMRTPAFVMESLGGTLRFTLSLEQVDDG